MELNDQEIIYLVLSFIFSFLLACIILFSKINCEFSSIVSIFCAVFFLTFYFYQPFLISLDRLKSYIIYYSIEEINFDIKYFLDWEYQIIGWAGTIFSNFILPFHINYVLSGYESFCDKLKDSFKRYIKEKKNYFIFLGLYGLITLIAQKTSDKKAEYTFETASFIYNALQIPDLFNALWYLGSFFPFLIGQLRVEFDIFKSDEY